MPVNSSCRCSTCLIGQSRVCCQSSRINSDSGQGGHMITGLKLIRWAGLSADEVLRCPLVFIDGVLCVVWQVRVVDRVVEMVALEWGLDPRRYCDSMSSKLFEQAIDFEVRRSASAYHRLLGLVPSVYSRRMWERRLNMSLEIPDVAAQAITHWRAAHDTRKVVRTVPSGQSERKAA